MCRTGMGSSMMLKIKVEKLIDKKGYRDKIFFQEKGCGFKKYMYFYIHQIAHPQRFIHKNSILKIH